MFNDEQYQTYKQALRSRRLPLAFVDLDAFDANIRYVRKIAEGTGRTIRVGTKSIRCEPLIKRIFELGGECFQGMLTYTAEETAWLAGKGYDDFIIAYPTVQQSDLELIIDMAGTGIKVLPMVDCLEHFQVLSVAAGAKGVNLGICLDIDMSYRLFNSKKYHLGIRRSPLRTSSDVLEFLEETEKLPNITLKAVMGYEGHIAATNDAVPGKAVKNMILRTLKKISVRELTARRQAVVKTVEDTAGIPLEIVNGGGSGSLISTLKDDSITEVTVGSAFFCPGLFHHFAEVTYQPAAFFAIQIVRRPAENMITCLGGGYAASGAVGPEKLPLPALPVGMKYLSLEGAGEVQTPFILPEYCPELGLGDPVILQHAKGGELCEHFDELLLLKNGSLVGKAQTYRGEGKVFL